MSDVDSRSLGRGEDADGMSATPDFDRGWQDDGHTIVPTIETEGAGVRIVCPGPERCKAKFGCEHCNAGGYVYEDGVEKPCPVCDEEGQDPAQSGKCWLVEAIGYTMSEAEACCNGEQTDVSAGHEIVWQDQGSFDDPQPFWKSKGVESYDDRRKRRAAEHQRAALAVSGRVADHERTQETG